MKIICRPRVIVSDNSSTDYPYNVQLWHSYDGGKTFVYSGYGKFFKNSTEAKRYAEENTKEA